MWVLRSGGVSVRGGLQAREKDGRNCWNESQVSCPDPTDLGDVVCASAGGEATGAAAAAGMDSGNCRTSKRRTAGRVGVWGALIVEAMDRGLLSCSRGRELVW